MYKLITTALAVTILSGCGIISTKPITPEKFTELKGKKLAVTTPIESRLSVLTVGGAMVSGLTVFTGSEDDLSKMYGLKDPAIEISKIVELNLIKKSKIKIKQHKSLSELSRDPLEIASQFKGVDYVLDINTVSMMFSYRPFDFGTYKLMYNAKLQLVESKTNSVIAESICSNVTDDEVSISYDEYLEDNAKLLKAEFERATNLCAVEFSKSILRI